MMDGGMVRAAAHSGGGTGRTGAVRSASMTSFKGTRKLRNCPFSSVGLIDPARIRSWEAKLRLKAEAR